MSRIGFACLSFVFAACVDHAYTVDATIAVPPAAAGHAMLVAEYNLAEWDWTHLPPGDLGEIMLATTSDGKATTAKVHKLGCPDDIYVVAWVDLTGQSGLAAQLAGRTLTNEKDYATLWPFHYLAPASGDMLGITGPVSSSDCTASGVTTSVLVRLP